MLHPGVPVWLRAPLWDWIEKALPYDADAIVQNYDTVTWNPSPYAPRMKGAGSLRTLVTDQEQTLRFVDYLLAIRAGDADRLEGVLRLSGSMWRVGERGNFAGLERRVAEAIQNSADAAMDAGGDAGTLLSEAWHAAFGRSPNTSLAYSKSIKAVEEASIPVVLPKCPSATLGTVIQTLRQHGDWRLPLTKEHPLAESWDTVVHMCQSLWSGQTDRHGSNNHRPPTQEEAETAVFLAVPLVQ